MTESLPTTMQIQLHYDVITEFERLEELAEEWDRLWESVSTREIFQSFAWARAWWHSYGCDYTLHCFAVYDGKTLIGIVPLVKQNTSLHFLGAPRADYTDILCAEGREVEVLTIVFNALHNSPEWQECKIEHLPSDSRLVRYWNKLPASIQRYSCLVFGIYCQSIVVAAEHPDILNKMARKKDIRQHVNKISKAGEVNFRFLETQPEAHNCLNDFFRQHVRRRILMRKYSRCEEPAFRRLLEGLVSGLDLHDQLRFSVLELNGNPIAYQFGFDTPGKYTMYQQTFDVNAWDYSPGNVLLRYTLLYANEKHVQEFDFSVGDEPYKTRYANRLKTNLTLYFVPPNLRGLVVCAFHSFLGKLRQKAVEAKPLLQRNPTIHNALVWASEYYAGAKSASTGSKWPNRKSNTAQLQVARAFRSIWRRRDDIVFRYVGANDRPDRRDQNTQIIQSRLSDIADLLLENDDFPGDLDSWRNRFQRGDRLWIVREHGSAVLAAWTTCDPTVLASLDYKCSIDLESSCLGYECWFGRPQDMSRAYRCLVSFLVRHALQEGKTLWVCCPWSAEAQKQQLATHGFASKYRIREWQISRRLHWRRVTPTPHLFRKTVRDRESSEETVTFVAR